MVGNRKVVVAKVPVRTCEELKLAEGREIKWPTQMEIERGRPMKDGLVRRWRFDYLWTCFVLVGVFGCLAFAALSLRAFSFSAFSVSLRSAFTSTL